MIHAGHGPKRWSRAECLDAMVNKEALEFYPRRCLKLRSRFAADRGDCAEPARLLAREAALRQT
jgi:hypothetical protein